MWGGENALQLPNCPVLVIKHIMCTLVLCYAHTSLAILFAYSVYVMYTTVLYADDAEDHAPHHTLTNGTYVQ
jgi:hypothetical protein